MGFVTGPVNKERLKRDYEGAIWLKDLLIKRLEKMPIRTKDEEERLARYIRERKIWADVLEELKK